MNSLISRKRWLQAIAGMLTLGMLSGCGPFVRSDYDANANLTNYRTFSFQQEKTERVRSRAFDNPINEKRLRDAVAAEMAQRGLQPAAESATGDLLVEVAIGSRLNERDYYTPRWGVGMGWGWGRRGYYGSGILADDDVLYRENRISVDVYDAKTREPVWHAAISTDVSTLTGENAQARINDAVKAMFAKFPRNAAPAAGGIKS